MSLTATLVPETVGASDYLPAVVPSPAPSAGSTPTFTVGALAAETDPGHHAQKVAPRARPEGVATLVEEGGEAPDMVPPRPAGSKHSASTTPVGVGEALLVVMPMTPPLGSEANKALATVVTRQPPASPTNRRGGKDTAARDTGAADRRR